MTSTMTPTTPTTPGTLAPHAPGEPLHTFGLRALTFLAAHGATATSDTLQRAAQCYQLATAGDGDTPAGAARRVQADRLILSLMLDAPAMATAAGDTAPAPAPTVAAPTAPTVAAPARTPTTATARTLARVRRVAADLSPLDAF